LLETVPDMTSEEEKKIPRIAKQKKRGELVLIRSANKEYEQPQKGARTARETNLGKDWCT